MERQGQAIRLAAKPPGKVQSVPVGPDVHFDNTQYHPFLVQDFQGEGGRVRGYQFFDPKDARVHPVTFTRELLREELAQILSHPEQVDEELQALFGAFAA